MVMIKRTLELLIRLIISHDAIHDLFTSHIAVINNFFIVLSVTLLSYSMYNSSQLWNLIDLLQFTVTLSIHFIHNIMATSLKLKLATTGRPD